MQQIDDALRGRTDIPVRFIGIQEQGPGFSASMFDDTTMTWLREVDGQEPSKTWTVPLPARPTGAVEYRDAIILDHNNSFYAVQNLTTERISDNQTNLDKFVATIQAAATTEDSDGDRLPDHWELDTFGNLDATTSTPTSGNIPALTAFVTGATPAPFAISQRSTRPFIFSLAVRLGTSTAGLRFQLQASTDGGKTWIYNPTDWELDAASSYTPYDGTGTRISAFRYLPSSTPGPDTLFRFHIATP